MRRIPGKPPHLQATPLPQLSGPPTPSPSPLPQVTLHSSLRPIPCPHCTPFPPAFCSLCQVLPKAVQDKVCWRGRLTGWPGAWLVTPGCVTPGKPLPPWFLTPHLDYIIDPQSGVLGASFTVPLRGTEMKF